VSAKDSVVDVDHVLWQRGGGICLRRALRRGVVGVALACAAAVFLCAGTATADPVGQVTEFPIPTSGSERNGIAAGPDGDLWFTENLAGKIGRITPGGVVSEFSIPTPGTRPTDIAAGPDGNLWFTEEDGDIGQITRSGAVTEFPDGSARAR
jgi:virginiamycin B lyase